MNKHFDETIRSKIVLAICTMFFGITSIIAWNLPVLKFQRQGIAVGAYLDDITGFQLAFGGTVYRNAVSPSDPVPLPLNLCPLATCGIVFIILGFLMSVISYVMTLKNMNNKCWKCLVVLSSIFYLAGGIISFFLQKSFQISNQIESVSYFKPMMLTDYNVCPFIGIVGIVSSVLAGLQIIFFKRKETN